MWPSAMALNINRGLNRKKKQLLFGVVLLELEAMNEFFRRRLCHWDRVLVLNASKSALDPAEALKIPEISTPAQNTNRKISMPGEAMNCVGSGGFFSVCDKIPERGPRRLGFREGCDPLTSLFRLCRTSECPSHCYASRIAYTC
ncbi:hypothetical protein TcasGA2_TC002872 [Tribolium castaneum]|uniref:Uncharacterized protein n=1 Tax=Tribolium castaneum TaxID=7070 RepID=D6WHT8_TRICA|nr:hypothetical protein TcasGA2_TC002872 [Tribolium castaneum]